MSWNQRSNRCGTLSGYRSGCRCQDCIKASREYLRAWRMKNKGYNTEYMAEKRKVYGSYYGNKAQQEYHRVRLQFKAEGKDDIL